MDISQLKTLIHVAELGSVSKASQRLNIAQPALSRQIGLMEAELGIALFERHSRGMVPTETGRLVLEHAARVLGELDTLRAAAMGGHGALHGPVNVGMTPTIAQIVTVPMVAALKVAAPGLSLRFLSAFSGHLNDWIRRGDIDVALTYNPQPSKSLRTRLVMIESLLLVGSAQARLTLDRTVPFRDLAGLDLVLPSAPHGLRTILDTCAVQAGIELRTSVEVDSYGPMIELVKSGMGYAVLPLPPIFDMVEAGVLTVAPLVEPTPERQLATVHSADRPVSAAARFVGQQFATIAQDLIERGIWAGRLTDA